MMEDSWSAILKAPYTNFFEKIFKNFIRHIGSTITKFAYVTKDSQSAHSETPEYTFLWIIEHIIEVK